jgi:hypothetical protein
MEPVSHVTSRMWSQPARTRFQSDYPPELPMHVPPAPSPSAAGEAASPSGAVPSPHERAMSPTAEVVRTVVITASGHSKREGRSKSRGRCGHECARAVVCVWSGWGGVGWGGVGWVSGGVGWGGRQGRRAAGRGRGVWVVMGQPCVGVPCCPYGLFV